MSEASEVANSVQTKEENNNGIKRLIGVLVAILLEVLFNIAIARWLNSYAEWIAIATRLLAAALVLTIYNEEKTSAMKMPWIILIMVAPVLGVTLYLIIGFNAGEHEMRIRYQLIDESLLPLLPKHEEAIDNLGRRDQRKANISRYLLDRARYPLYENSDIRYFDDATEAMEAQKAEFRQARDFIFMEYHAIENAESWHQIQQILEERAAAGVEVRVFYDDMGSIGFINTDFVDLLKSRGIRCRVFNPFKFGLNLFLNNRDHRKITVVDGRVGFTGGYNIADEYFNLTHPFGQWKDTGVRIEGEAVKSLTVAFLEMWNAVQTKDPNDANDTDYTRYLPEVTYERREMGTFVQPYADSPLDGDRIGEDVYISVAEYAKDYAWFVTPYLILTDEMIHALGLAAKRGVDVRVITPGIPDKKLVYSITRSYYHGLVRNGVRIFEWTPGFCHAKMSVADDTLATCGTINLDYRSLYHHFENGCLYCDCRAVADTRRDFEHIMAESREVTQDYVSPTAGKKVSQMLLRLVAPLM